MSLWCIIPLQEETIMKIKQTIKCPFVSNLNISVSNFVDKINRLCVLLHKHTNMTQTQTKPQIVEVKMNHPHNAYLATKINNNVNELKKKLCDDN